MRQSDVDCRFTFPATWRSFPDGKALLRAAGEHRLEGVVSKRGAAPYRSGSSRDWQQIKTQAWREANRERWRLFEGADSAEKSPRPGISISDNRVVGRRGHPYVSRTSEILSSAMPNAALASVAGAAHSLMVTHAAELAGLVGEHISKAEALK